MLPKVLDLFALVEEGYVIQSVVPAWNGALTMTVAKGNTTHVFHFHPYEVPAIHQECNVVGLAK